MSGTHSYPKLEMTPNLLEKVLNLPALPSPKGTVSHLVDHWEKMYLLHIVVSLCMVIMGLFITFHVYTKLRAIRKLEIADCMYLQKIRGRATKILTDFIITSYVGIRILFGLAITKSNSLS